MMQFYITELEEKIVNFRANYGRLPSKILLTRAVYENLRHEAGTYCSAPTTLKNPKFMGIPIEIDDFSATANF